MSPRRHVERLCLGCGVRGGSRCTEMFDDNNGLEDFHDFQSGFKDECDKEDVKEEPDIKEESDDNYEPGPKKPKKSKIKGKRGGGRKKLFFKQFDPESGLEKYRCDKCDMWFDSFFSYRNHTKYHEQENQDQKIHNCLLCNKEYEHSGILIYHMQRDHLKDGEFKCDFCSKTFASHDRNRFEFHLTKEHEIGDYRFKCDICHSAFPTECYLNKHKKAVHVKQSFDVVCEQCGKSFKTKGGLEAHIKAHHACSNS